MLKDRLLRGAEKLFRVQILFASLGLGLVSPLGLNTGSFIRFSGWVVLFTCFMMLLLFVNFSMLGDAGLFCPTSG
jgi:hypothetical protein